MRRVPLVLPVLLLATAAWSQTRQEFLDRRARIDQHHQAHSAASALGDSASTSSPTATVSNPLVITDIRFNEGADGTLTIVGEAVNSTGSTLTFPTVSFDIYTSADAYLGSDYTYTFNPSNVRLVPSGIFTSGLPSAGVAFFLVYTDVPYYLAAKYSYTSEGEVYGFTPAIASLSLGSAALAPNWWGGTDVVGSVANTSNRALTYFSSVALAGNDASGRLLDVTWTYVNGVSVACNSVSSESGIAPLGSAPFSDSFLEPFVTSMRRVAFEWDESALSKAAATFGAGGGNDSFAVFSNCAWSAASTVPWITVTGGAGGQDDGTVGYTVEPNSTGAARSGSIQVGTGASVIPMTVTQAAGGCAYALTPPQTAVRARGGQTSVGVTTGSGCAWTSSANVPWIVISSGANGVGTGNTQFIVQPNPHRVRRTGTITIAGQNHVVIQSGAAPSDYQGDNISDVTVFRPSAGTWFVLQSDTSAGRGIGWGASADTPVAGDYDGDAVTDAAVYRPSSGTWFLLLSSTNAGVGVQWGLAGDIPVPADYDGDGRTDAAVYRPSEGIWYIVRSSTGTAVAVTWGSGSDIPVPADYDGDGKADPTVFRPSESMWYQLRSATGSGFGVTWGQVGDVPVAGDYDGDGKADPTVFRASAGTWFELRSATGTGFGVLWGGSGDQPIVGDYDGDGKMDPTVFRPSTNTWYELRSTTGVGHGVVWGAPGDLPQ